MNNLPFRRHLFTAFLLVVSGTCHALNVSLLTDKLKSPWAIAVEPTSNQLLITEKNGQLLRFDLSKRQLHVITKIPSVAVQGQGGFMDIALAPDYQKSAKVFFTYTKRVKKGYATALASASLRTDSDQWSLDNWQDVLVTQSASTSGHHFGSRIAFDNQQHLFFSVGDRGERSNAQDLTNHAGSILRLNLDGSIPSDNPFINRAGALPEIYSYGHRNPQGLAFIERSQQLLAVEHGPRGGDEINLILAGANYGWPIISYGKEYWGPISVGESTAKAGMLQPLMQYTPSIAPSSLIFYQADYYPSLNQSLLLGALALRHLNQIKFSQPIDQLTHAKQHPFTSIQWLKKAQRRIRDLAVLPNGKIVLISDRGELLMLER